MYDRRGKERKEVGGRRVAMREMRDRGRLDTSKEISQNTTIICIVYLEGVAF